MRYTGLGNRDTVCLEQSKIRYDSRKKITRVLTSPAKTPVDVSAPILPDIGRELLAVANENPRHVFSRTGNGRPETAVKHWQDDLRAVFRGTGIPKGRPRQVRDTAAVAWLNARIPLDEVSRLLGHSSIKTTEKHYAPCVKSRQDRLDALVVAAWK
jgi:integrase